jgi:hypothetical protein
LLPPAKRHQQQQQQQQGQPRVHKQDIEVPADAVPGTSVLQVKLPWGQVLQVDVPEGATPGTKFAIQVPVPPGADTPGAQMFSCDVTVPADYAPGKTINVRLPWGVMHPVEPPAGSKPGDKFQVEVPVPPEVAAQIEQHEHVCEVPAGLEAGTAASASSGGGAKAAAEGSASDGEAEDEDFNKPGWRKSTLLRTKDTMDYDGEMMRSAHCPHPTHPTHSTHPTPPNRRTYPLAHVCGQTHCSMSLGDHSPTCSAAIALSLGACQAAIVPWKVLAPRALAMCRHSMHRLRSCASTFGEMPLAADSTQSTTPGVRPWVTLWMALSIIPSYCRINGSSHGCEL